MTKLSFTDWNVIKSMLEQGFSISEISRTFKISRKSIYEMSWRKGWRKKKRKNFFIEFYKKWKGVKKNEKII